MKKTKISCDVDLKVRQGIDAQAKAQGISRAKFIEMAVEDKLEGVNVHKENKRLTEARRDAERKIITFEKRVTTLEEQVEAQKAEYHRLEGERKYLTEQVEKLNASLTKTEKKRAAYKEASEQLNKENKMLSSAIRDAERQIKDLEASVEQKKKERDTFKTRAEDAESNHSVCNEKLTLLMGRNWWQRLRDILPWEQV